MIDADAKSVARQVESGRAFAASKGWTVANAHVYADAAVSGAETKKLVQRSRLLDVIGAHPPFSALILRDASRFSRRDGDEAFGELKRIAQAGVEVWFYQDGTRFEYGSFASN
jgi:DNA invertase Pin-like site-specific DNA recombinase